MEIVFKDLKHAARVLFKARGVTAIAMFALMLGIGANTAIFNVVNAVLLKPLPYPDSERLVRLWEQSQNDVHLSIAYPNFVDWREQNKTLEQIAAVRPAAFNMTGGGDPERLPGRLVSWGFLPTLGIEPTVGRNFLPEEDSPGGSLSVIVSYAMWQRRFGGDPGLIGRALTLNGRDYTVVGILPANFSYYYPVDLYVPIESERNPLMRKRDFRGGITAIGRLKKGVTIEQARADFASIANGLSQKFTEDFGFGTAVESMYETTVESIRPTLLVLFGAVAFVLLISCSNVANLQLARATARQKEIAIRTALGASRRRIIRQLLTESVLLSVAGGGLGLLLAMWGTDALLALTPGTIPRWEGIRVDARVLLFTFGVSLITGIAFGLVPALQASRIELNESLKDTGRGITGGRHRVRSALVVIEVALALVLVIGAGLMIRSVMMLRGVNSGMDVQNVLTMELPLNPSSYPDSDGIRNYHRRLLQQVGSLTGVEAVGLNADMPLSGDDSEAPFWVGQGELPPMADMPWAVFYPVSAGYRQAMRIPLLSGRFFNEHDTEKSPRVAVIDELLSRGIFHGESPIGRTLKIPSIAGVGEIDCEIVGVVGHVKHWGLDTDSQAKYQYQLYIPHTQLPDTFFAPLSQNMTLVARTKTDPSSMMLAIKRQIQAVDKDQPLNNVRSMQEIVSASISERTFALLLMGIFAGVAMLLAVIGIYGVMSYSVTQRTSEMGIRVALGATAGDVIRLVAKQGMLLAIVGIGIGLAAAMAVTRLMSHLLFGVSATDPLTFGLIAILLGAVALCACYLPARRASRVDPIVALRYE